MRFQACILPHLCKIRAHHRALQKFFWGSPLTAFLKSDFVPFPEGEVDFQITYEGVDDFVVAVGESVGPHPELGLEQRYPEHAGPAPQLYHSLSSERIRVVLRPIGHEVRTLP